MRQRCELHQVGLEIHDQQKRRFKRFESSNCALGCTYTQSCNPCFGSDEADSRCPFGPFSHCTKGHTAAWHMGTLK